MVEHRQPYGRDVGHRPIDSLRPMHFHGFSILEKQLGRLGTSQGTWLGAVSGGFLAETDGSVQK